jgi:hypothetical protein
MSKYIELTRGFKTQVDEADYPRLMEYKWYALRSARGVYAARRNDPGMYPRILLMHRHLLQAPDGLEVDHKDHDSLNNTRANLRLATKSQNGASTRRFDAEGNVKPFRGVGFYRGKWVASIKVDRKNIYLGRYEQLEEALKAYNAAATRYFGEFAKLNVLPEEAA